jgi:flagellar hook-length control protein FliK
VSKAGEEVSALSVALAQTQAMAQPQPKPPQKPALQGEGLQDEEGAGWEDPTQGGGESVTAGQYSSSRATGRERNAEFQGKEQLARGGYNFAEPPTPAQHEGGQDGVATTELFDQIQSTLVKTEEGGGLAVTADASKDLSAQIELLPHVGATSEELAEIPGEIHSEAEQSAVALPLAFEVEEAAVSAPEQINLGAHRIDHTKRESGERAQALPDFIQQSDRTVPLTFTDQTRQMMSVSHPRDASVNRGGDVSIQMALLRQAFESVKGFGAGQLHQESKPATSSGQALGVANGSARAQGDLQSKPVKPMTKVQVHRMLERVETALKEAARSRDGKTIRFRVEPFDLGEVKIDVSLREGLLHARLKAENQQVTSVLRDRAHELQGALRKLGLEVDSVTVTVSDEAEVDLGTGQQGSAGGKTFQEERNNMPGEMAQVVENTIGNELAQVSSADPLRITDAILDHWVA